MAVRSALQAAFLASTLVLACFAGSAAAADRVYWANGGSTTNTNRIAYANLNGTGGGNLATAGATIGATRGVALDVAAGKVYWTSRDIGRISFANLDGSGGGDLNTSGATVNVPNAAAAYPGSGRVYWANETGDSISFANLNNTGGGGNLFTGAASIDFPIAPVVDPGSGRIYWGNGGNGATSNTIAYANLNGSGGGNISTTGATVANPHGVALDPVAGRIYWANIGLPTGSVNVISWANLDGTGGGNLTLPGATVNVPVGLAIDPVARKIYWANQGGNSIWSANLDGSAAAAVPTGGASLQGSRSPVLLKTPVGTGAPALTGGSAAGSALTCSPGSWAADLLGSWLYRAPQRLAYSWTRNGAAIPGATGNTHTATAGGSYACSVTASNPAGSSSQTSAAHAVTAPSFGPKTRVTIRPPARRIPSRGPVKVVIVNKNSFAVSAKLSMRLAARRISARGSVKVDVTNANSFPVSGSVAAAPARSITIRSKPFAVRAQAKKRVSLKLPKAVRKQFKRKKKLAVRLTLRLKDPAGNTRTVRKSFVLKLKR